MTPAVGKYILDGHDAVLEDDLHMWVIWYENAAGSDRLRVGYDRFTDYDGNSIEVSTVFLALNFNFLGGEPQLFESLITGGELDGQMQRFPTWDEAERYHKVIVNRLRPMGTVS